MADQEGGSSGGGGSSLSFVLFLLVAIILAWFLSGAAKNADIGTLFFALPGTNSPFASSSVSIIEAPSVAGYGSNSSSGSFDPIETNQITDEVAAVRKQVESLKSYPTSSHAGEVTIEPAQAGRVAGAQGEYIILHASASNKTPVVISDWRIESAVSKKVGYIRTGVDTYISSGLGLLGAIILNPGDEAIVSTSRSLLAHHFA